jgi:hypothetical protein
LGPEYIYDTLYPRYGVPLQINALPVSLGRHIRQGPSLRSEGCSTAARDKVHLARNELELSIFSLSLSLSLSLSQAARHGLPTTPVRRLEYRECIEHLLLFDSRHLAPQHSGHRPLQLRDFDCARVVGVDIIKRAQVREDMTCTTVDNKLLPRPPAG